MIVLNQDFLSQWVGFYTIVYGDIIKILITGHRKHKLENYSVDFIKLAISEILDEIQILNPIGISGMANGVDLWFLEEFRKRNLIYWCYIPFLEQMKYMDEDDVILRESLINSSTRQFHLRNSKMVEDADSGVVVWDGNKGGTHNALQQLIEKKKPFYWINPVKEKIYHID